MRIDSNSDRGCQSGNLLLARGAAHFRANAAGGLEAVAAIRFGFPRENALFAVLYRDPFEAVDANHESTARLARICPREPDLGDFPALAAG